MIDIGFIAGPVEGGIRDPLQQQLPLAVGAEDGPPPGAAYCPKCGQPALIQQEGCATCVSCGYSKCS